MIKKLKQVVINLIGYSAIVTLMGWMVTEGLRQLTV